MKVYLGGYIYRGKDGETLKKCFAWRKQIIDFYADYKGARYPIDFLCPLNSNEADSIDEKGLHSNLSHNMIVAKDRLAVENADIIITNLNTFGETRPPIGTISELVWASEFRKPVIVITDEDQYAEHPFIKTFASVIVPNVEKMLEEKTLNIFYKSINSAQY